MGLGFGAFGKMPALGDFFQSNPPPGFVAVWDAWLQSSMISTAEAGGAAWDDQYMSAPLWRFTLSAGVAGPGKVMGVLMPSVDRVGRRFPLTLMAVLPTQGPAAMDHLNETSLFEQVEDAALASLEDDMTRDALVARLADLSPADNRNCAPLRRAGDALVLTQVEGTEIAPELAAGLIGATMAAPCLWTAALNGTSRAMICDGLPDAQQSRALFDLSAPLWTEARPTA